jgi:hypothetical protein
MWGGRLRVVEHTKHRPASLARFFADADVVVGAMGSAFMWTTVMPPGAVSVELVRSIGCARGFPAGWGTAAECEFGGNAWCLGQRHLTVHVPRRCGGGGDDGRGNASSTQGHETWHAVPSEAWRHIFAAARCALDANSASSPIPTASARAQSGLGPTSLRSDEPSPDGGSPALLTSTCPTVPASAFDECAAASGAAQLDEE